jgi:hypothetical protein
MPPDQLLAEDLINKYDDVRRFFINHSGKEAISLFIKSYGCGDGWGVYHLFENIFISMIVTMS